MSIRRDEAWPDAPRCTDCGSPTRVQRHGQRPLLVLLLTVPSPNARLDLMRVKEWATEAEAEAEAAAREADRVLIAGVDLWVLAAGEV